MKRFKNLRIQEFNIQLLPLLFTIITFLFLCGMLYLFIQLLNVFPITDKIIPRFFLTDIFVGLTIYLKTSVDFALFIGNLMSKFSGFKNRIAIEIGTALGNGLGTFFVLCIWTFFKEVPILMIIMIVIASLVLLKLAEEGLGEFIVLKNLLSKVNSLFYPILACIIPKIKKKTDTKNTFLSLFLFSLTIPLLLGLDDFAGYIPLFSIVHVFGFAVGVFLGHMLLNIFLFASPFKTIQLVKQPRIALLGSLAFIGIAFWGFVEAFRILQTIR